MKLYVTLLVVTALAWHHGALAQCDCDCTCPTTASTCSPDGTTTTKPPTTTTTAKTTTSTTTAAPTTSTTTTSTTTTSTTTTSTTTTSTTTTSTTTTSTTTTTTTTTSTSTTSTTTTSTTTTSTTTAVPTTTTISPYECGVYTIEEGKQVPLQSPDYPEKYGKSDTCVWELTCDNANGVISISCDDFKTEPAESGEECKDGDFVRIKDGSKNLGEFCDTTGPDLTTSDNYMKIKFDTDGDSTRKRGFSCTAMCTVPTTTSTTQSTTTTTLSYSGQCSGEWTAVTGVATWESPNYDGATHYPDADYCCWLNVTIPDTLFGVTLVMSSQAGIHETSGCNGDQITYISSSGFESKICGDIGGQNWVETSFLTTPVTFGFQWCSDSSDGGTDIGFQLTLTGKPL